MEEVPKKIAFVTGANKGLGFEITRQLCFKGYTVWMAARDRSMLAQSAGMLRGEGHDVVAVELDVTDQVQMGALIEKIKKEQVFFDAIINNAGVRFDADIGILDVDTKMMVDTLMTNSVAPLQIIRAFLPFLKKGCRIVMMSSGLGSFCGEISHHSPIYSGSKTLLNSITRQLAPLLAKRDVAIHAVSPGWVRTSMGGPDALRTVKQGAETPVWLATEVGVDQTGKFWRDMKEISW